MIKTTEIVNEDGRTFTIRIIHEGDYYGLNDGVRHNKSGTMVEFFDNTPRKGSTDTPMGLFVSRYYLSDLDNGESCSLNLEGDMDDRRVSNRWLTNLRLSIWHISAQNVTDVIAFATPPR